MHQGIERKMSAKADLMPGTGGQEAERAVSCPVMIQRSSIIHRGSGAVTINYGLKFLRNYAGLTELLRFAVIREERRFAAIISNPGKEILPWQKLS